MESTGYALVLHGAGEPRLTSARDRCSGAFMVYSYMLDGDTLWLTQQRNQNGPFANPFTSKAVRVE